MQVTINLFIFAVMQLYFILTDAIKLNKTRASKPLVVKILLLYYYNITFVLLQFVKISSNKIM